MNIICDFQAYFANDYDGTNTDGMDCLSQWNGDTYYTYGLPHYEVSCVSTCYHWSPCGLQYPAERAFTSDWFVNISIMVVYKNIF